jgi:glutamine---fructose-6-phosphate transaminase (isomerizing)
MPPTTDSFMYQTIQRQPADLQRLMTEGWTTAQDAAKLIRDSRRVYVTGIGTSYHAALVGAWLLRAAGLDARAVLSFDLAFYPESYGLGPQDAVVVMAHTGVKTYSSVALQRAVSEGATVISVGSQSADHPGSQLILRTTEREKSAAYTSSHLCAMTVLAQVATEVGEATDAKATSDFRTALQALSDHVSNILRREKEIEPIAEMAIPKRVYAAGAGPNEATALELVIKAREAAYGQVDALAAEQFLHGPMVAVNKGDLAVVIHVSGAAEKRTGEISLVLDGIGTDLWIVGKKVDGLTDATAFPLPESPETLSPLLAVVPMQLLAFQMAVRKGINPDTFRRDDPVYKEAFGRLTL